MSRPKPETDVQPEPEAEAAPKPEGKAKPEAAVSTATKPEAEADPSLTPNRRRGTAEPDAAVIFSSPASSKTRRMPGVSSPQAIAQAQAPIAVPKTPDAEPEPEAEAEDTARSDAQSPPSDHMNYSSGRPR